MTFSEKTRFEQAIEGFDAANREDPRRTIFQEQEWPSALLYGMRMSEWLEKLSPQAPEALRLAVRCQHIRRWQVPRASYPMTRPGYHRWRTDLARFHAEEAGKIMRTVGYDEPTVLRVQSLVRKEKLKTDPDAQTLEDVACLVFLEGEFADFAARHPEDKVIDILRKTWRKMSDRGHAAALTLVGTLPATSRALVEKALG